MGRIFIDQKSLKVMSWSGESKDWLKDGMKKNKNLFLNLISWTRFHFSFNP